MKSVIASCLAMVVSCSLLSCAVVDRLGVSLGQRGQLTIVEDGESRAVIVVAPGEEHAQQAAEALQKYIEKMSGARPNILQEGEEAAASVRIYVGHTAAAKKNGIEIPSGFDPSIRDDAFEEEGYVLKTKGNSIFVGGNSDGPYRGTIYGAYAFLEKLGCRWYFPGEWGEIVPKRKTVTVPHLDVESRPDFPLRRISPGGSWGVVTPEERDIYADWCDKIGFNGGHSGMYPVVGDGFLGLLLPVDWYWDEHPEYYANKENPRSDYGAAPAFAKPEVYAEMVKNIRAAFADPQKAARHRIEPHGFGVSPPDAGGARGEEYFGRSEGFRYPAYTYPYEFTQSEEFYRFIVKLAKEFPDKYIATMAYQLREMPPQGVTIPHNVTAMHTPIACCGLHPNNHPSCWRRQEYVKMLKQWRERTPHVYLYEYNPDFLTGIFVPARATANAVINYPLYKQLDIKGISAEGRKAFMQTWTSYYVTAKLLWDADTDVDALKEEFYSTFFGPEAGPHVQAWWDACEEALLAAKNHGHHVFVVMSHIYTPEFARRIHKFVEAALNSEMTDEQRGRVEAFAIIADHLEAYAEMKRADMELRYEDAAAQAERMIQHKRKLHAIYSFFITPSDAVPLRSTFARGWKKRYEGLLAKINGEEGTLVAPLPLEMSFARDPFNEGVIAEWYSPDFDDSGWGAKNTFFIWDQQDEPEDEKGHDYDGYGWYRGTFEVPTEFEGKPIRFYCRGVINEGWVWVNGEYVGHQPYNNWWMHRPRPFDLDITEFVEPGKANTIAIRVWNNAEMGGMYSRGFFYSPKE